MRITAYKFLCFLVLLAPIKSFAEHSECDQFASEQPFFYEFSNIVEKKGPITREQLDQVRRILHCRTDVEEYCETVINYNLEKNPQTLTIAKVKRYFGHLHVIHPMNKDRWNYKISEKKGVKEFSVSGIEAGKEIPETKISFKYANGKCSPIKN